MVFHSDGDIRSLMAWGVMSSLWRSSPPIRWFEDKAVQAWNKIDKIKQELKSNKITEVQN